MQKLPTGSPVSLELTCSHFWPGGHGFSPGLQGAAHWQEPAASTHSLPPPQSAGPPGFSLSTTPLQSWSLQSHTSGTLLVPPRQEKMPFTQAHWPSVHSPADSPHESPMFASGGGFGFA